MLYGTLGSDTARVIARNGETRISAVLQSDTVRIEVEFDGEEVTVTTREVGVAEVPKRMLGAEVRLATPEEREDGEDSVVLVEKANEVRPREEVLPRD